MRSPARLAQALLPFALACGPKAEPADNKRDFRLSETFGRYGLVFANPRAAICYSAVFAEGTGGDETAADEKSCPRITQINENQRGFRGK